jgi:hypothetical protein
MPITEYGNCYSKIDGCDGQCVNELIGKVLKCIHNMAYGVLWIWTKIIWTNICGPSKLSVVKKFF